MNQITKNDSQSMTQDIVKNNIEQLKNLFPEVFSENRIDFEALQSLLGEYVDKDDERYSFNWKGKANARRIAQTPSTATLRPAKEESKNWDKTENLYIEGDNLEVLKLLQKSYHNKIKIIYIDPPYNTGKDFVYPDDFKDNLKNYLELTGQVSEDGKKTSTNSDMSGRYHSNWLNMIYPRLKLARNLLSDDGVIFISIDENELSNLKKVCDEIFGDENYISTLSIENNPKGRKNSDFISNSSDFCLIYSKNKSKSYFIENIPKNIKEMGLDEDGKYVHKSGKRVLIGENTFNPKVIDFKSEKHYSVYFKTLTKELEIRKETQIDQIDTKLVDSGFVRYVSQRDGVFIENTYTESKLRQLFLNGALEFQDEKIFEKNFNDTIRLKNLVLNEEYDALINNKSQKFKLDLKTTTANQWLKLLFNTEEEYFSSPKPVGLLKLLLTLLDSKDFVTLDFFSGSGTTAEAIMHLNVEDNGIRKFIMVQLPEPLDNKSEAYKAGYKNICEIGKERIRRAGDKIVKELKEKQSTQKLLTDENQVNPDDLDIGFKVFKLDTSNIKTWDSSTENVQQALLDSVSNIKSERSQEDVLYEVLLKYGLDLTLPIEEFEQNGKKLYSVGFGSLVICLDNDIDISIAEKIVEIKDAKKPETINVIFKDNGFKDDVVKTNTIQLLTKHGVESVRSI